MPATVPAISGHSRRMMSRKYGPPKVCQTLVTIAGTITIAIACPGGMVTASRPIDTVGRPSPITPLTKPASRNAKPIRMRRGSNMDRTLTHRPSGHNLEITEIALGSDEGCLLVIARDKRKAFAQGSVSDEAILSVMPHDGLLRAASLAMTA